MNFWAPCSSKKHPQSTAQKLSLFLTSAWALRNCNFSEHLLLAQKLLKLLSFSKHMFWAFIVPPCIRRAQSWGAEDIGCEDERVNRGVAKYQGNRRRTQRSRCDLVSQVLCSVRVPCSVLGSHTDNCLRPALTRDQGDLSSERKRATWRLSPRQFHCDLIIQTGVVNGQGRHSLV